MCPRAGSIEFLNQLWLELSQEVHCGFEVWIRGAKGLALLDKALEEALVVVDLILFGVLNTTINLVPPNKEKQIKTGFFSWDEFAERISESDLKYIRMLLENLKQNKT